MGEPGGRDPDQAARHLLGRLMGEAREDDLIEHAGLALDRAHNRRVIMSVGDDPPGRDAVEDALPVRGFEPGALAAHDLCHHRLQRVLREGVPNGGCFARAHRSRMVLSASLRSQSRSWQDN